MKTDSPLNLPILPKDPGVYLYKNDKGDIIYVGKAKNLKKRVSSYFTTQAQQHPKTKILVQHIKSVDTIIVETELESLLLENRLIKKYRPKYNIYFKDDKTYAYIHFTDAQIPIISSKRVTHLKGKYFGPYANGYLRIKLIEFCVKYFNIITPKTFSTQSNLNYELEQAPAKTLEEVDMLWYQSKVKEAQQFLQKRNIKQLKKEIEKEMIEHSQKLEFEHAKEKKKLLELLIQIDEEEQRVDVMKQYNQDIFVFKRLKDNTTQIVLLHITKGSILKKEEYKIQEYHFLYDWFLRYYSTHFPPHEIIVYQNIFDEISQEELDELSEELRLLHKRAINFVVPQKGDKKKLLDLAYKNLNYRIEQKTILEQMQDALSLPILPKVIECFDMSNFSYDYTVGGMVQFVDGVENKSGYRKFEIKSLHKKQDDFTAMRECVYRRYYGLKEAGEKMPDLIMIDGGLGQLGVSVEALESLQLDVPIISLAKQEEEIYSKDSQIPLKFDKESEMMRFIRHVRNSVHNYVVSYNKKKREMRAREEV